MYVTLLQAIFSGLQQVQVLKKLHQMRALQLSLGLLSCCLASRVRALVRRVLWKVSGEVHSKGVLQTLKILA